MGFDFHQQMRVFFDIAVFACQRVAYKNLCFGAYGYRSIIAVSRQYPVRTFIGGVAYHAKQRPGLLYAVYRPIGIKNFVAAMFGIGLRKHHQFDIGGISAEILKACRQIIDFIIR